MQIKGDAYIKSNPLCFLLNRSTESLRQTGTDVHHQIRRLPTYSQNKTNDLMLNLTPENVTQHSRIVTTTHKGSSTPTKMSKIIGRQIH